MKSFTALLGSLVLLSLLSAAAYGQTAGTGAIAGVVSDPSGAVVSQATIKVTNNQTGEKRTAVSASGGNYTVPLLPPGAYMVEVSKSGFKTSTHRECDGDRPTEHPTSGGRHIGNRRSNRPRGTVADGVERGGPRDRREDRGEHALGDAQFHPDHRTLQWGFNGGDERG